MDLATYKQNVAELESIPASINFSPAGLHAMLALASFAGQVVDTAKRAIYYGKPFNAEKFDEAFAKLQNVVGFMGSLGAERLAGPQEGIVKYLVDNGAEQGLVQSFEQMSFEELDVRLLHAVIGSNTESGELCEALAKVIAGHPLDLVNIKEEFGDLEWYRAVAMMVLSLSDEELRSSNIKKLMDKKAGRYKSGSFSVEEAHNRDTDAERTLLEEDFNKGLH